MSCSGVCRQRRQPCPTPGECRASSALDVLLVIMASCLFCTTVLVLFIWLL